MQRRDLREFHPRSADLPRLRSGLHHLPRHTTRPLLEFSCLGDPVGPACHTGARTCYFTEISLKLKKKKAKEATSQKTLEHVPRPTLMRLEDTIESRRLASLTPKEGQKASWTVKLLNDRELLCEKIVEEAHELCDTLMNDEGKKRTIEEMADVMYHCMVLLNRQVRRE